MIPPIRNIDRKPTANSIGVEKVSFPRYIVKIQLNIFTPVGIAIRNVMRLKNGRYTAPVVNMWCAHTEKPRAPMATVAKTNALYPNSGLREKTGRISLIMPIAGRTIT